MPYLNTCNMPARTGPAQLWSPQCNCLIAPTMGAGGGGLLLACLLMCLGDATVCYGGVPGMHTPVRDVLWTSHRTNLNGGRHVGYAMKHTCVACMLTATTLTHSPPGPCKTGKTGKTVQNGAKRVQNDAKRCKTVQNGCKMGAKWVQIV